MYQQFFVLFAIVFTGYFLRKINILDDHMNNGLNRFIVYFAYPSLIVLSIGSLELTDGLLIDFLFMLLLTLGFFGLYSVFAYLYAKMRKFPISKANVIELSMTSPNNGFMGLPIALVFFGEKGLLLMIAHNAAMNIYFFSYGLICLRRNNENHGRIEIKVIIIELFKLLLNPNILSLIIGMFICLNGIVFFPPIERYLTIIGNVATPMAMIFVGSTLANSKIKHIFANHIVIEAALVKLIAMPLLTYLCLALMPISPLIIATSVLGSAFPSAATVSILAEQECQDTEMSSQILFLSTLLSIGTLTLFLKLILEYIM